MAGNGVVLKPSPHAALSGARIARVFARAGLPPGLLQVVQGHAATGGALVEAPVAQVRFTGSALAGAKVLETCARGVKRVVAELGGTDAAIVCADANIARAVEGIAWGAFANAGQSGGSIERVYVLREVADELLAGLVARAQALRVGDPADAETEIGPLVGGERLGRVMELLDDAVTQGATLHCGGPVMVDGFSGAFCAPAVLTGVPAGARLAREEAPGPVVAVTVVDREEDAITAANDSTLGLGASVWTADRYKGERIARELQVGMVWMNDHHIARSAPQLPWGGVHGSGIGRARGAIALRTCAEPKVITWDPPRGKAFWWFPYDRALARTVRAVAHLRSTRDADRERGLRDGAAPALTVAARTLRTLRRK
jgi:acyl-CoA reductase-like NAD-dependent aldehyde dehydrogenase